MLILTCRYFTCDIKIRFKNTNFLMVDDTAEYHTFFSNTLVDNIKTEKQKKKKTRIKLLY